MARAPSKKSKMEQAFLGQAANDNDLSWARQKQWRRVETIMDEVMWDPAIVKQARDYITEKLALLEREEKENESPSRTQ